jgi:hypothetical protein
MDSQDKDFDEKMQARFKELPKVVQDAITSADIQRRMRALADTNKLHLDQWEALENEVMLSLLGFQAVGDLQKNIKQETGVSDEVATNLASEVSKIVFEPIRQELERGLSHPEAKAQEFSGVETARRQEIATQKSQPAPAVIPATPGAPVNEAKAVRAPISDVYKPGELSSERKVVENDPYREMAV